jgi:hypothetical protein
VAAHDELQALAHVVERVEHRQEALAGDGEREIDAVRHELVDEYPAAGARSHFCLTT